MLNIFNIGDRVSFQNIKGTVVAGLVNGRTLDGKWFLCYLVQFDKGTDDTIPELRNCEMNFFTSVFPINEKFLTKIY